MIFSFTFTSSTFCLINIFLKILKCFATYKCCHPCSVMNSEHCILYIIMPMYFVSKIVFDRKFFLLPISFEMYYCTINCQIRFYFILKHASKYKSILLALKEMIFFIHYNIYEGLCNFMLV